MCCGKIALSLHDIDYFVRATPEDIPLSLVFFFFHCPTINTRRIHEAICDMCDVGFTRVRRRDRHEVQTKADLHRLIWEITQCAFVRECIESGLIKYRCGNVVWGNADKVTRSTGKSEMSKWRCEEEEEEGGERRRDATHSHYFNLNYMTGGREVNYRWQW